MYLYNVYNIPTLCMMNKQINKNNFFNNTYDIMPHGFDCQQKND